MATTNRCSTCEKGAGAYFCTGCKAYFCMKDLKKHHEQLLTELDILVEDRNALQEKLNKGNQQQHSSDPILSQIDQWEQAVVAKVEQVANQVRQQVANMDDAKRSELSVNFEKFSKELAQLKETEDLYHDDLTRLQQMLLQLNEDLKQLPHSSTIVLRTEQTNQIIWNSLIYIEEKSTSSKHVSQQPQQQKAAKNRHLVAPMKTELECGGHPCAKCGKCCDYYYDQTWKTRSDSNCAAHKVLVDIDFLRGFHRRAGGLCMCN